MLSNITIEFRAMPSKNNKVNIKSDVSVSYFLENIVGIAAESITSHVLTADGEVYSCGYNYYGQFGANYDTGYNANVYPMKMQKVSNIIQISAGDCYVEMLDADGTVWGVGYKIEK